MAKLLPVQYAKILFELTKDVKKEDVDTVLQVFIDRLSKDQMLKKIDYILETYEAYAKEQEGIVQLDITTARGTSKKVIENITKAFGGNVEVKTQVDETLIGGVVVKHGNTVLDGSVKTQLQTLKRSLI